MNYLPLMARTQTVGIALSLVGIFTVLKGLYEHECHIKIKGCIQIVTGCLLCMLYLCIAYLTGI